MSIVSYLAYPVDGYKDQLVMDLKQHPHCEVVLSDNSDVFIVLTDTETEEQEKATQEFLQGHKGLLCLAMVYGQLEGEDRACGEQREESDGMTTGEVLSEER